MTANANILKADGEREPFDPRKLDASLARAGAAKDARERIIARIESELYEGMTTEEIYRHAFEYLRRDEAPPVAARYSIKRAVFALGPSGFPFEQFLGEVLRAHGWAVRTGAELYGRCAPHEVDVLAERAGKRVGIEAKFHNAASGKTDIKDALYVRARYEDLARAAEQSSRVDDGWLVTNTRFTKNAIRYAQCANLTLIAWEYPKGRGLRSLIEEGGVHPLTCLTTLTEGEKQRLMDAKIVLCKNVQSGHLLEEYGVKPARIPCVLDEAKHLCTVG
ncbi:ATPase [Candidatus Kaiserbacteria bacterium CG10_big_fil_rev_8_21_14_0_10_59_10]|uniref:ATPase n=1 Tax=Candidatus Kaiserbacteria bacterium CG10_big_fil_rev_8_21_14_0_10_59_10 TaxID=1974612 RepID=A0A2H0U718_9BACT|nr:MAG: ATPase [Candidatus Kaiserbacteria bacterium CG10_big_fil_rev_8_21_14_0_10_59_10]